MSAIRAGRRRVRGVLSGILGLAALAVLGRFAWIRIREELAIAALGSPSEGARVAAARTLGELGTLRAIPALLDCARRHDADGDSSTIVDGRNPAHVFDALDGILRPAALPMILRLLDAPEEPDRFWAARALERLDVQTDEVFEALEKTLRNRNDDSSLAAASAMVQFGSRAASCLLAVILEAWRWNSETDVVRYHLQWQLVRLGPLAVEAVPRLILSRDIEGDPLRYLDEGYWSLIGEEIAQRRRAGGGVGQEFLADEAASWMYYVHFDPRARAAAPAFEHLLDDPSPALRRDAVAALWRATGNATEKMFCVARDLVEAADDDDREYFSSLLAAFEGGGHGAEEAAPPSLAELLASARSPDLESFDHAVAIDALMDHEPKPPDLPVLEALLRAPECEIRVTAAHALGKLALAAGQASPLLLAALSDPAPPVRVLAAHALWKLGVDGETARAALVRDLPAALKMEEGRLLEAAMEALVALSLNDPAALRELLTQPLTLTHTYQALERLGPGAAPALPLLIKVLEDPGSRDPDEVHEVYDVLGSIGPAARSVAGQLRRAAGARGSRDDNLPALLRCLSAIDDSPDTLSILEQSLDDVDARVRNAASQGLLRQGAGAEVIVPALVSRLRRNRSAIVASVALSRIGAAAVPELSAALEEPAADLRTWAAWTLGGMGSAAAGAIPALASRLADESDLVRAAASEALGHLGSVAMAALPALENLAKASSAEDPRNIVRRRAALAARRLQGLETLPPPVRELPREERSCCGTPGAHRIESFHSAICDRH